MTEVEPRLKAWVLCACGCGDEGPARRKAWLDGMHSRGCTCRRCTSGQHAKAEKRRVGRFARKTGLTQQPGSGRRIGYDLGGLVAVEETSDQDIVRHLRLWWAMVVVQRKLRRVRAQRQIPWAFVASWEGKAQLVVMDPQGFAELCEAAMGPG